MGIAGALCVVGAARPGGIAAAGAGLWEVSRSATGAGAERVCLADVAALAQWEARGASCPREKLSEQANEVTFEYRCAGSDFGHSKMTLLTPRALRIETQGIAGGLPFDTVLHARRVGPCRTR